MAVSNVLPCWRRGVGAASHFCVQLTVLPILIVNFGGGTGSRGGEAATCVAAFAFRGLPHRFVEVACGGASAGGGVGSGMVSRSLSAKLV